MKQERPMDRRYRQWGSLQDSVKVTVRLSRRTKAILSALCKDDEGLISYGAVIEKLAEQHSAVLEEDGERPQARKIF